MFKQRRIFILMLKVKRDSSRQQHAVTVAVLNPLVGLMAFNTGGSYPTEERGGVTKGCTHRNIYTQHTQGKGSFISCILSFLSTGLDKAIKPWVTSKASLLLRPGVWHPQESLNTFPQKHEAHKQRTKCSMPTLNKWKKDGSRSKNCILCEPLLRIQWMGLQWSQMEALCISPLVSRLVGIWCCGNDSENILHMWLV